MEILITVETDAFEHRRVKPHFINPCCFGEDFAAWLKAQISPVTSEEFMFSDIIQEDYGWGFWARTSKDPFWIAISYVGTGPQESPAQRVISVNSDPVLNVFKRLFHRADKVALQHLRETVRRAIVSNPEITVVHSPSYGK